MEPGVWSMEPGGMVQRLLLTWNLSHGAWLQDTERGVLKTKAKILNDVKTRNLL
jgi:hypothetical protein